MATLTEIPVRPTRVVLEGVPRASFYEGQRCPEDFTFPGSLRACLEYMGENRGCEHVPGYDKALRPGCLYAYLNGTSGMAWRLLWHIARWDYGNGNILGIATDPEEPIRRAFESVGHGYEMLLRGDLARQIGFRGTVCDDEAPYRQRIVKSLRDKGRPVIGLGVAGPPECCVITGYDEGGDVLLGWSYFQGFPEFAASLEFEPSGYLRKRDWFKDTQGLIVIGDRGEMPPLEEIDRRALRWALEIMRTPRIRDYHAGLAAYTAWADMLLRDDQLPAEDMAALRDHYGVHFDAVGNVAEGRWYGALLLKEMAERQPAMAAELQAARECFEAEHDLMWAVWEFAGGNGFTDEHARKLARRGVRERIVPLIRLARKLDAEAADHIERALGLS